MGERCLIPYCQHEGIWVLGIRARLTKDGEGKTRTPGKKATDAAFAPNLPAFLCDTHVHDGCTLTLLVVPTQSGKTRVRAIGVADDAPPTREVEIQ